MPSLAQGLYELLVTQLLEEQLRHPQLQGTPDVDELRNAEAADRIALHVAEREGRLWTRMDEDGFLFTGSGYHYVNRLGYVITEVPVPDDVSVDVYDEEDLQEWEERTLEEQAAEEQ
jgi:hypothetical protein